MKREEPAERCVLRAQTISRSQRKERDGPGLDVRTPTSKDVWNEIQVASKYLGFTCLVSENSLELCRFLTGF